jgi:hypothetical protein
MAEGSSKRIKITVKTPKEKKDIEIDEEETVERVIIVALKKYNHRLESRKILRVKNMKSCFVKSNNLIRGVNVIKR